MNQTILKDQAPFSFMSELNSSASSEYDWYVEGNSSMGTQVLIIGLHATPSSKLNVIKIDSHVITLLPVKNEKNWETACPSRDLMYLFKMIESHSLGFILGISIKKLDNLLRGWLLFKVHFC